VIGRDCGVHAERACLPAFSSAQMTVLLSLFGAPTIERGGTTRALQFERRTQLLVYLALRRT
jgi:hypothetical protein